MDYVIDTAVGPLAYYLNPSDTTVVVGGTTATTTATTVAVGTLTMCPWV